MLLSRSVPGPGSLNRYLHLPSEHEVTLDDTVNVGYTHNDAACLSSDGAYTYLYDDEHRLVEV
ncbi:MAG: hypothetical protein JW889_05430 [Verrucomicrobia bacterium]|nr:hypothetical protein [Verrucomicrobiota bacterium]